MSGGGGGDGRDDGFKVPVPVRPKTSVGGTADGPGGGGAAPGVAGGGGGGVEERDPCDIVQTAALNSPQPAVVAGLSVGDILDVVLGGTAARPILEVRTQVGAIAGSLTHRGHVEIINCINDGNAYEAVVVQKSGGIVTVRVQRK